MSSKPTHNAYIVTTARETNGKDYWTRVGSVFAHQKGKGFDVVIPAGISVSGRIVCTEPKDEHKS